MIADEVTDEYNQISQMMNITKYRRDQRMPTGLTPHKRLLSHPSEKLIRRGEVWTLNGMALAFIAQK
jgi:hypothetical protein